MCTPRVPNSAPAGGRVHLTARQVAAVAGLVLLAGCSTSSPSPHPNGVGGTSSAATTNSNTGQGGSSNAEPSGGAGGASAGAAGEASGAPTCTHEPSKAEFSCEGEAAQFASYVVDHAFGPGQSNGQDDFPDLVLGPPEGGGCCQGAIDSVVSLGNGGWVTLGFEGNAIVDGPGPDFIVFENAFYVGGNRTNVFAELATVAVSDDGQHWVEFPCTANHAPYGHCAGWHPTLANAANNDLDPTDPAVAGGDAFDLRDVCLSQARFVRITDRPDLNASLDGVFDLDAVAIVNGACSR